MVFFLLINFRDCFCNFIEFVILVSTLHRESLEATSEDKTRVIITLYYCPIVTDKLSEILMQEPSVIKFERAGAPFFSLRDSKRMGK